LKYCNVSVNADADQGPSLNHNLKYFAAFILIAGGYATCFYGIFNLKLGEGNWWGVVSVPLGIALAVYGVSLLFDVTTQRSDLTPDVSQLREEFVANRYEPLSDDVHKNNLAVTGLRRFLSDRIVGIANVPHIWVATSKVKTEVGLMPFAEGVTIGDDSEVKKQESLVFIGGHTGEIVGPNHNLIQVGYERLILGGQVSLGGWPLPYCLTKRLIGKPEGSKLRGEKFSNLLLVVFNVWQRMKRNHDRECKAFSSRGFAYVSEPQVYPELLIGCKFITPEWTAAVHDVGSLINLERALGVIKGRSRSLGGALCRSRRMSASVQSACCNCSAPPCLIRGTVRGICSSNHFPPLLISDTRVEGGGEESKCGGHNASYVYAILAIIASVALSFYCFWNLKFGTQDWRLLLGLLVVAFCGIFYGSIELLNIIAEQTQFCGDAVVVHPIVQGAGHFANIGAQSIYGFLQ
jgi:hypothetical protein